MNNIIMNIQPCVGLVDDRIHLTVSELENGQAVTLVAFMTDAGMTFRSDAQYTADDNGFIDLQTAHSTGGSYTGKEPMGLLWSMKQAPGQRKGLWLLKKEVSKPFVVEVYLIDGHVEVLDREDLQKHRCLGRETLRRFYQAPDVVAVPVKEGSLRGMLFLPHGSGPFPGVIDIFGAVGGLTPHRAALLASRGFAALSLVYFKFDDLYPYVELHLEYFREAADWLHSHPLVLKDGIGVIGLSKGASLALETAILSNKVNAVVAVNPQSCHCVGTHYFEDRMQPIVNKTFYDLNNTSEGVVLGEAFKYSDVNKYAIIQVERAENANFLFIVGEDDKATHPNEATILADRLTRGKKTSTEEDRFKILSYPGTGHLIDPPYTPHYRSCHTSFIGMLCLFGGETKAHSIAQEDSWREMLRFLRHNLITANPTPQQHVNNFWDRKSSPSSKL